ncbi:tRNA1(Val) (adenine(37)-N6)-methyltransferase [uncultured Clostridium sp.]|jgi:tRNA1(Val) A37 N6-methylase TrmN6|uniref:tRNA1(Val) (adenine(37)-N6)-methyltransferase n=1 Tax=uncultured Clostridium sp. TaxID=59620 RepID=UPI00261C5EDC|nr:tRNA1(Val) (adenine(37)-N6)-methyltransferase [uncultured Clostridium sp.]
MSNTKEMDMSLLKDDESLDDLQLDGIHLIQKNDGFRFGVDAVLLANFANVKNKHTVVDLCTGTGIIPFIIKGKRNPKKIIGVEIQSEFAEMANRSKMINGFDDDIEFIEGDLKDINLIKKLPRADVLTVNPPYKLRNAGIVNETDKLSIARHEIMCTLEDVIASSRKILNDNGRMFIVHRPERLADIFTIMRKYKIEPKRVQMIHPNTKKAANIVLVEGQRDGGAFLKWEAPLFVYDENGNYSDEINKIYGK